MMTDDELAKVSRGIPIDTNPDGTPRDLVASLLAEIALQVGRVATNTAKPELHVNANQIRKAWESTGMRMYEDRFVDALKALGVVIDEVSEK
jgi:hypothetical protein